MNYIDYYKFGRNSRTDPIEIISRPVRSILGGRTVYVDSDTHCDPTSLRARILGCALLALSFYFLPVTTTLCTVVLVGAFAIGFYARDEKRIAETSEMVKVLIQNYMDASSDRDKFTILEDWPELRHNPKLEFNLLIKRQFSEWRWSPWGIGRLLRMIPSFRHEYIQEAFEKDWQSNLLNIDKLTEKYRTILRIAFEVEARSPEGVDLDLLCQRTDFSPLEVASMAYFHLQMRDTKGIRVHFPGMGGFDQINDPNYGSTSRALKKYFSLVNTPTHPRPELDDRIRYSEYARSLENKLAWLPFETSLGKKLRAVLDQWKVYCDPRATNKPDLKNLVAETKSISEMKFTNEQVLDILLVEFWKKISPSFLSKVEGL